MAEKKFVIVETSDNIRELAIAPDTYLKEGQKVVITSKFFEDKKCLKYAKVVKTISAYSSDAKAIIEYLFDITKLESVVAECFEEENENG